MVLQSPYTASNAGVDVPECKSGKSGNCSLLASSRKYNMNVNKQDHSLVQGGTDFASGTKEVGSGSWPKPAAVAP